MKFFDMIQNRAWALHPAKLDEINLFIESRLNGEKIEFKGETGKSGNKADDPYVVTDGVAVIPVYGTLQKRMNLFASFSGGTSTELLKKDVLHALDNPKVSAIVLDVDSPGGSVDGTKELADVVYASHKQKPVVTYANGMMASAAYWVGSAANAIVTNETAMIGSIGVVLTHIDRSARDDKAGIKRTQIYAGKYKRIASDEKPLSEEGQEYLQAMVDEYYSIFVDAIAQNRGVSTEAVLKMADGKDFIGKQALEIGLIDHIGTLETAINLAKSMGERFMDLKILQEKHPDLYQQVLDLGAQSVDTEKLIADSTASGIQAERQRVTEILAVEDADPAARHQAVTDGLSVDASFKLFFEMEKTQKQKRLEDLQDQTPESVGQTGKEKDDENKADFMTEVDRYRKEHNCTRTDALKTVAAQNPQLHEAWLKQ
jgi:signal peptide peptidase SppA